MEQSTIEQAEQPVKPTRKKTVDKPAKPTAEELKALAKEEQTRLANGQLVRNKTNPFIGKSIGEIRFYANESLADIKERMSRG